MIYEEEKGPDKTKLTILLAVMVCFFIGIVVYVLGNVAAKNTTTANANIQQDEEEEVVTDESADICVLKAIDTTAQTMTLYDIETQMTVDLTYNGGTDITDKYNKIISATQLIEGQMVDASYDLSANTLTNLQISTQTWEYQGVTKLNLDRTNKSIRLYDRNYQYTSKLYCKDADGEIALLSINQCDELTIRGYDKTVYSITVTKGHGSVKLTNYEYFYGGNLTIGTQDYTSLTSDMVFTVREGITTLTIEQGDVTGTKIITVERNQQTEVDMSAFTPEPTPTGEVTFEIAPFGAKLKIDGEEVTYTKPVELEYGSYQIEVSADGYETYEGSIEVEKAEDTVVISLTEASEDTSEESTDEESEDESSSTSEDEESTDETTDESVGVGSTGTGSESASTASTSQESTSNSTATDSSTTSDSTASSEDSSETTEEEVDSEHTIYITGPTGASVYINGVYQGIVPLEMTKPLGLTYITFVENGYEQITHVVEIEDDEEDKTYTFPELTASESDDN